MIKLNSKTELSDKGIYKITNLVNGKFYIGSTKRNFSRRFSNHKSFFNKFLNGGKNTHPKLFNAIKKYGWENFSFEILEIIKDSLVILEKEEFYINLLNPTYNICRNPTKGGMPNKGRKLSKEWKNNISKKSKLYFHKGDVLINKIKQNKELASQYKIINANTNEVFIGSGVDCSIKIGVKHTLFISAIWLFPNRTKHYHGWNIEKLKSQKKKIIVKIKNEKIIFNSFGECDRYFNMWRGYTSTKTLRKELLLDRYCYEII